MDWIRLLGTAVLTTLLIQTASAKNKTGKEWAASGQKVIWETSQIFHRATIGLSSFNKEKSAELVQAASKTAKIAGVFGVLGALFSAIMTVTPGVSKESPELQYMKTEFGKMSEKVDTIARSLNDTKNLIKSETQKTAYIGYANNINNGYTQMQACLRGLESVRCSNQSECKRKKTLVVESYIGSMNVRPDVNAILQGVISGSEFGVSLLELMKENSKCNIPKINIFVNKIVGLMTKGLTASMFHDLYKKSDYNGMGEPVLANKMISAMERKRHAIQNSCFANIKYWVGDDIRNAYESFSSDITATNTKHLRDLKMKYPWVEWHVHHI